MCIICWEMDQDPVPKCIGLVRNVVDVVRDFDILLLMRHHSKVLYRWGLRRRGKRGKHGKIGVMRKWHFLDKTPYFPQGNEGQ